MKREKAENLIRLINLLSTRKLKIGELARILNVQTKQIKKYFVALEEIKLHVDEDLDGRCFIFGADKLHKSELEPQEKTWLTSLIYLHAPEHPLTAAIVHKLQVEQSPVPSAQQLTDVRLANNFHLINLALRQNQRIWIKNYHSPSGKKPLSDRLIEPIAFIDEHRQLKAYEIASRKVKSFKIDRMENVSITAEPCTKLPKYPSHHDPFGFSCTKYQMIVLKLSPLAKELMSENYPLSQPFLSLEAPDGHYYKGPISSPVGIGRFILGLPGHVKVEEGEELKGYLQEEIRKFNF